MKKRPVEIYRLELRSWEPPFAKIFVHCSSGTYIRSLSRDLALAAGSRGYLTSLIRTQVAAFKLENAIKMRTPEIGAQTAPDNSARKGVLCNNSKWCSPNECTSIQEMRPCFSKGSGREGVSGIMPHGVGPMDVAFWKQQRAAEKLEMRNEKRGEIAIPYLHPINRAIFHSLNISCFDISADDAQKAAQGKPLENILKNVSPALLKEADTAALFLEDTLIAVIEKSSDKWNYGYVYGSN
jgi:hypothetical protein